MAERIYYDDGEMIAERPLPDRRWGVVCVVQSNPEHGRQVLAGKDFYYRRSGLWYESDLIGLLDQLTAHFDEIECVLVGRMTDNETYNRIVTRAKSEGELPPQTALGLLDAKAR